MATVSQANLLHRWESVIFLLSTILGSWLGMQMAHEFGHMTGAWLTGGQVSQVALDPLGISRTELSSNPRPLAVAWAGPALGVLLPLFLALVAARVRMPGAFVLRFFGGFCLVANGLYLGAGSFGQVGDCGDMLRHGSDRWQLWLFGAIAFPAGFALWHGQGKYFGLGRAGVPVSRRVVYATLVVFLALIAIGFVVGAGESAGS